MKLYIISQDANTGFETYDAAVVCAPDELTARNMNPRTGEPMTDAQWKENHSTWCSSVEQVKVQYLGVAEEGVTTRLVIASFNAG